MRRTTTIIFAVLISMTPAITLGIQQTFAQQPSDQEVNPGVDVVMACRVANKAAQSECIWQKDGKPLRIIAGKYEWNGAREVGDCSVRIVRADINYDDGEWRCQVTAGSFEDDDALSSKRARLVVRVPPQDPRIFHDGVALGPSRTKQGLTIKAGGTARVSCESRGGNPAAVLKWYIDDEEVGSDILQKNQTNSRDLKKFDAVSVIDITLEKRHNGKLLKCLSLHDAFPRKAREETAELDVHFAPSVSLERNAEDVYDLEADKDSLSIRCVAEANPRPDIVWRKAGSSEAIFRIGEELVFDPVRQIDGGTYFCRASNVVGSSDELAITFTVRYEPRNIRTRPARILELEVGGSARLECFADGNPEPAFQWWHTAEEGGDEEEKTDADENGEEDKSRHRLRSQEREFDLSNATYEHEGLWRCVASNMIKDKERRIESAPIRVDISGRPQALSHKTDRIQPFSRDSDAQVEVVFCSDPRPASVEWEWDTSSGNFRLGIPESRGRFKAHALRPHPSRPDDCYVAKFGISDVLPSDARPYSLVARNDRGAMRYSVRVAVLDPIAMTTVVGITAALLLLLVVAAFAAAFWYRGRRRNSGSGGCFKKAESRHHEARRAPTLSAGSTFYPASVFLQSEPPPPLEGPDLYGTTGGTSVVPPYSPPVFPGELQRANQDVIDRSLQRSTGVSSGGGGRRSPPQHQQQHQQHQQQHGENGSSSSASRPRFKPTYPLPPISQFPLGGRHHLLPQRRKTEQNFDRMMGSPTPPSGSLNGIIDEDSLVGRGQMQTEESGGNVGGGGMPLRPPGVMYADLQFPKSVNSGSLMTAKLGRISSSLLLADEGSAAAASGSHYSTSRARERADI